MSFSVVAEKKCAAAATAAAAAAAFVDDDVGRYDATTRQKESLARKSVILVTFHLSYTASQRGWKKERNQDCVKVLLND